MKNVSKAVNIAKGENMKAKHDLLGIFLAAVAGSVFLAALLVRTFLPRIIIPKLDLPATVLLSLAALVLDCYISHRSHDVRLVPLYGVLVFGLFPWAASFASPIDAIKSAVIGGVVFTVCTLLFDTVTDRLSSGPAAKAAPLISAFVMYLASQCLMGLVR